MQKSVLVRKVLWGRGMKVHPREYCDKLQNLSIVRSEDMGCSNLTVEK